MRILKWYGWVLGSLALLLGSVFLPGFLASGKDIDIPVHSKDSARIIAHNLKREGVLHFALPFRVLTKLTHADRRLKAGLYRMNARMSLWEVVTTLSEGKSELLTLKVPEGFTMEQVARELERMKVVPALEFLRACEDVPFLRGLGVEGRAAEGFLFPETYRVPLGAGARELVELMVRQFFDSVGPDLSRQAGAKGLTPYQAVIMASIIEKECKRDDERPIVAGVLYNRMRMKMRLEVNATLNYVLNTKNPWFTNAQIGTESPYNTYLHRGLPPTPICNPGLPSLRAVLAPADVPYLYYVAQGDGSNLFAQTFQEHHRNVRRAKAVLRAKKRQGVRTIPP